MKARIHHFPRRHWGAIFVGAAAVIVGVGFVTVRMQRAVPKINTAEVRLGEFVDNVEVRGQVKTLKSIVLTAPFGAGDIQILKLVKNGIRVKRGEILVQFDVSTLQRTLDQKRSELRQAEAEIERVRAEGRLLEEQNLTQVTKARYDVERARLEVSKQEILSKIEGEKTKLSLSDAQKKLNELETKLSSDRTGNGADVESKRQKRAKALFEVREAERNIVSMSLSAPADGLVTLMPNLRSRTNWNTEPPEFKEGDRAWAGAPIAELPDLSNVRINGRIDETERGRLKPGQTATVTVDAIPAREFTAHVSEIGSLAKLDFSTFPPPKNFDLILQLEQTDPKIRPGMSASGRIAVERLPDSILIPVEASFQKGGQTVAYVLQNSRFEERKIEVAKRGGSDLLISKGLKRGEQVALKDPATVAESRP
jgi:HlyD family secretion protein